MNRLFVFLCVVAVMFFSLSSVVIAVDVFTTEKKSATALTSMRASTEDASAANAARWDLSENEWERYEEIMLGEGKYYWDHLDPIFVLGLYARTDEERERYAERIAVQEYTLIERLTRLNQSYLPVFKRMYGHEPVIDIKKFNAFYGIDKTSRPAAKNTGFADSMGDRYVLFVSPGCSGCDDYYRKIELQQEFGTSLDIYFIGANDEQIMAWAKSVNLDPAKVKRGSVTLNHDEGTYARYNRPPLPSAFYYSKRTQSVHPITGMEGPQ